jgi:periplasmic protein TonB
MRYVSVLILIILVSASAFAQSGRRNLPPPPTPTPTPEAKPSPTPSSPPGEQVTAEKDQDYRCTDDGTLAHLLDPPQVEAYTSGKDVDVKAEITARPDPGYTREARRAAVQGYVVLKLLLLSDGKLDRVRVVRPLPYGLTENAIRAACKIKFKPAMKAGQPVSQWVTVQYLFRLADSSIFGP